MKDLIVPDGAEVHTPSADSFIRVNGVAYRGHVVELWRRYAGIVGAMDRLFGSKREDGVAITGLTIRPPTDQVDNWLLVARGRRKGKRVVAFHRGRSSADCIEAFDIRRSSDAVDWRDDQPPAEAGGVGGPPERDELPPLEGV